MVDETKPQASTSETAKSSKRVKKVTVIWQTQPENIAKDDNEIEDELEYKSDNNNFSKQYSLCTLAKLPEPVPKLTSQNYYSVSGLAPETWYL